MAFVKLFVKKEPQFEKLNFSQQQMARIGTVGVSTVVARAASARNANDQPAKPLSKAYAIRKSLLRSRQLSAGSAGLSDVTVATTRKVRTKGGGFRIRRSYSTIGTGSGALRTNKRDLTLTGSMLRELSIRSVSENVARAGWTTSPNRQKASNNDRVEKFIDFSPKNEQQVLESAGQVLKSVAGRLIKVRTK
jgi:hypothetical protein